MTTIINPRRINRTIVVERDSRTLTARVIDALDAPNGMAEMLADAEAARDDAQAAQVIAETARDESVIAGHQAVQAAADASASEANAASSEGVAVAAASDAVSALDAAVIARDAAQAAQGLAETARAGAETARSGAESAQAAAGTHAANAQSARAGAEAARDAAATSASNAATSEANANADAAATAADRVQTGLDAQATAADRVQTGLDRTAAASSASAAALSASMANGMPLGTIAHFAASVPPSGWLVCDGTAVTALYPDLRAFLIDAGSPYGVSGADPLLPDLRGEFVRGWDGGRGVDPGRVFGSAQGDAIRNIEGSLGASRAIQPPASPGAFTSASTSLNATGTGSTASDLRLFTFDASRVVPTADENRPRNIALLPCIRAYPTEDRSKILGEGQEWRNLIRARTAGEEYENTTGRTIQVNLTGKSTAAEGRPVETKQGTGAWVPVGYLPGSAAPVDGSASFAVPAAGGYRVTGPATIRYWSELSDRFDPAELFAAGEYGAWFDPSDLSSMYQDHLGAPQPAVGQPVWLMLDRSHGLLPGPQLGNMDLKPSDFTINGGAVVITDLGDRLRLTRTAAAAGAVQAEYRSLPVQAGKTYDADFRLLAVGGDSAVQPYAAINNGAATDFWGPSYQAAAMANRKINVATGAGSGTLHLRLSVSRSYNPSASVEGDWIEIAKTYSVREMPGNHAKQPTTTARPTLMQSGAVRYLYRDPVDDALPWTAPAGSYDIVHIPLTGPATVLTAQALSGATNILLAENTRAYLAIDRRLTAAELDKLRAY